MFVLLYDVSLARPNVHLNFQMRNHVLRNCLRFGTPAEATGGLVTLGEAWRDKIKPLGFQNWAWGSKLEPRGAKIVPKWSSGPPKPVQKGSKIGPNRCKIDQNGGLEILKRPKRPRGSKRAEQSPRKCPRRAQDSQTGGKWTPRPPQMIPKSSQNCSNMIPKSGQKRDWIRSCKTG